MPWTWLTPRFPTGSSRRCCGCTRRTTISSTAFGHRRHPLESRCRRASQEEVAKVHLGALAQAVLLDRAEYLDVLRDHGAAVAWDPAGAEFVSQYQDPERIFVQHNQEGLAAPVVSLPVQGTVLADSVVAARQLTALVGGAPPQRSHSDWYGALSVLACS